MAKVKAAEIRKMTSEEIKKKLEELKVEMIKARVSANKTGNSKLKEMRRLLARILTIEKNHIKNESNKGK